MPRLALPMTSLLLGRFFLTDSSTSAGTESPTFRTTLLKISRALKDITGAPHCSTTQRRRRKEGGGEDEEVSGWRVRSRMGSTEKSSARAMRSCRSGDNGWLWSISLSLYIYLFFNFWWRGWGVIYISLSTKHHGRVHSPTWKITNENRI